MLLPFTRRTTQRAFSVLTRPNTHSLCRTAMASHHRLARITIVSDYSVVVNLFLTSTKGPDDLQKTLFLLVLAEPFSRVAGERHHFTDEFLLGLGRFVGD